MISKSKVEKLVSLLEQWTRAEVIARLGRFDNLEFADYALIQIEKKDEIRKLLYGTSSLAELGERWGLLEERPKRKKKKKKKKRKAIYRRKK